MSKITIQVNNGEHTQTYDSIGDVSDGYHTFNELYDHRIALFLTLMMSAPATRRMSWWSRKHADGSEMPSWIIAGMDLPTGTITYHLPDSYVRDYLDTQIKELPNAPEWDGATPQDTVDRLLKLCVQPNFAAWMMGYPQNWTDLNSPSPNTEKPSLKPTGTP